MRWNTERGAISLPFLVPPATPEPDHGLPAITHRFGADLATMEKNLSHTPQTSCTLRTMPHLVYSAVGGGQGISGDNLAGQTKLRTFPARSTRPNRACRAGTGRTLAEAASQKRAPVRGGPSCRGLADGGSWALTQ